jgi:hypothetical protein
LRFEQSSNVLGVEDILSGNVSRKDIHTHAAQQNPVTTRSASQRGTIKRYVRPNGRTASVLCQHNKIMHGGNLIVVFERLQGDFVMLARREAAGK